MKKDRLRLLRISILVALVGPCYTAWANPDTSPNQKGVIEAYGNPCFKQGPLSFELNQGQSNPQVKFLLRGSGYTLFLTPTGATFLLYESRINVRDRSQPQAQSPQDNEPTETGDTEDMVAAAPDSLNPCFKQGSGTGLPLI